MHQASSHDPCRTRAIRGAGVYAAAMLAVVLLFAGLVQTAPALGAADVRDSRNDGVRRTAFVVGNSNYHHVKKLLNPSRDAEAVAATLTRIGFEVTTVIDGDQQTTAEALARFSRRSAGSDIALFYFAGHGIQINGENYFLPVSTKATATDAVIQQALSLNEVRRHLRRASPGLTIFILDSCRDDPFGPLTTKRSWKTAAPVTLQPGLAQVQSAAGMLVAYATQPGKLAYDGAGNHSPFTASLLRYLEEPDLEIRLMLGRVREDVVAHTDGAQIPWVEEAVLGEFYFSERSKPVETALRGGRADDVTFWRSIWRSTDPRDYQAYLGKYPDGAFATLATNRLEALKKSTLASMEMPFDAAETAKPEQWRLVQNSLFWLGYYNGKLTGVADTAVINAVQTFQTGTHEKPTGRLNQNQVKRLHDAAAASLITLGERLSDRVVFDRVRLRSIDRGITEIALPAYKQLMRKVTGDAEGRKILIEAKRQLDAMRRQRDLVKGYYERAAKDYLTVVAAAGAGYTAQVRQAQFGQARLGETKLAKIDSLGSRREVFLKHALDYAKEGRINENEWLDELR